MAPYGKYALIPLFLALSAFGGYATLGALGKNGLGAVLRDVLTGSRSALVGAPEPFKRSYTGISRVDRQLSTLVAFFSAAIDGDVPPENLLVFVWGMSQFAAGWTLMLLESLRAGNSGRVVSYAPILGFFMQNLTWTVSLPIWLVLHLLTSPVAKLQSADGATAKKALEPRNPWDAALIPISVVLAFVVPTVMMKVPGLSASAHYTWHAIWQVFPLWNALLLPLLRLGQNRTPGPGNKTPGPSSVYKFALLLAAVGHLPIAVLSVLPGPLRSLLAAHAPALLRPFVERGTLANIFVPPSWPLSAHQFSVDPTAYTSLERSHLATQFLQYDIYVGAVPFLLWALYLHRTAAKSAGLVDALAGAGFWFAVGGPHAAVAALLWNRDNDVLESGDGATKEEKKKN
ncbi:hypothetical protein BKA67DRAFT_535438 [Truncatella angustata]|uniref:Uncharacterized protein n=1 Tax=Truncatella angustata TaxID=152316 RepID=A0A9P8UKB6_9PEZI|nr:uncharacterized protein BKA67DRAFT_535438 [Truncatella angustata]KAH6654100.1 hypothetical protein BKA67DRAFT_535438 [Truncatella angustata]